LRNSPEDGDLVGSKQAAEAALTDNDTGTEISL
jgi:hypothetical protein